MANHFSPLGERASARAKNRVPLVVLSYWVIKIASTTLGETGADMFSMSLGLGYGATILLFVALFVVLLGIKLALQRYTPISYWAAFTGSAILGTAISDYLDRTLGLGYMAGSALLTVVLLLVLATWYLKERSLSVERIDTTTGELFYWLAFLIANTLGTAAGDFLADELGMGFMESAALIALLLILTALGHYFTRISGIFLFWVAFVLTRPFGATFGDLLTKTPAEGGLNLGTYGASLIFASLLILGLWYEHRAEGKRASPSE